MLWVYLQGIKWNLYWTKALWVGGRNKIQNKQTALKNSPKTRIKANTQTEHDWTNKNEGQK